MTQDFLDGMIVVLLPSMLAVAWLLWGATHADSRVPARPLDHQLYHAAIHRHATKRWRILRSSG